jgi:AraC-like DNA-binding protein
VQVVGREFETEEGSMLALRPHRRRTVVVPAGDRRYAALVMMMPLAQMARLSSTGRVPPFLHGRDGAILQGPEARRLQRYLEFMIADMLYDPSSEPPARTAQGVLSLVGDLLHDLSNAESQAGALQVRPISTRRVRGAEALLRQRADEPISIAALAEEIGVGLRSLQLSFREVHGMGPRQVLSRLRLERARDRLLRADPSEQVTTIALDCGFTHLSRFAEAYRQAFGERPRETLRRSA